MYSATTQEPHVVSIRNLSREFKKTADAFVRAAAVYYQVDPVL